MGDGGFDEDFDFDNDNWPVNNAPIRPLMPPRFGGRMANNARYNNAYGNYRGGYGPGGGFGPPMGPPMGRPPMGPPMRPPMGPRGPMIMFGRGFGPGGPPAPRNIPPETQAFRYLLRCGVSKESIKNLPKRMLILMEAHYCGVCAMEFDCFSMSRMHYTSRNHAKNQKKWITQNSDKPNGGKEIPLKARELYCELCDVHITSTAHAESHYAGKPHRAIVEGRKKAKNPFLLQKGMEARVEQLIRREKKHLPVQEVKKQEAAVTEKAPTQELYCDICKTSVTCSEQMTMHLNGKKHLSKEKQHIIRVMNNQQNGANGDDEKAAAPTEGETAATDDGDWGNGSGAWEDT